MTDPRYPPLEGCMSQPLRLVASGHRSRVLRRTALWGTLVGAHGWAVVDGHLLAGVGAVSSPGRHSPWGDRPFLVTSNCCLSFRGRSVPRSWRGGPSRPPAPLGPQDSYLVDSASSHMLVSKIKPCMSKYKHLYRETANGSLNQLSFI